MTALRTEQCCTWRAALTLSTVFITQNILSVSELNTEVKGQSSSLPARVILSASYLYLLLTISSCVDKPRISLLHFSVSVISVHKQHQYTNTHARVFTVKVLPERQVRCLTPCLPTEDRLRSQDGPLSETSRMRSVLRGSQRRINSDSSPFFTISDLNFNTVSRHNI